jgi:hypothetical protein
MEAVSWSAINYKPTTLPKLRTTNEISRRHSISSSAGDSGYLSDRDISLSPQDFVGPEDCKCIEARESRITLTDDVTDVLYPAYPNSPSLGLSGLKSIVEDTITSNHQKRQWTRKDDLNLFKKCVDGERVLPQKPLVTSDPHFSTCNEIESKLDWYVLPVRTYTICLTRIAGHLTIGSECSLLYPYLPRGAAVTTPPRTIASSKKTWTATPPCCQNLF